MNFPLSITTFESLAALNAEIDTEDIVVRFESPADEQAYEELDGKLAERIYRLLQERLGPDAEEKHFYINWDWFPNKGRSLTLSDSAFSRTLVLELAALLDGTYSDWRMFITVCHDLKAYDPRHIGDACLSRDRLLVSASLVRLINDEA